MYNLPIEISEVLQDDRSFLFILLILTIFLIGLVLGLIARFAAQSISARIEGFVHFVPNALTTIGVIGTFTGIFVGLLEFNVTDIDGSVPKLLVGLKIAFATSIAGMSAALSFRIIEHASRFVFGSRPIRETANDPIHILAEIKRSIDSLTKAMVGENDSSILSTLKLSRQDTNDGFKQQIIAFKEFSEHMKEGATKILIESLKNVIEDFNQNISTQFGDNFKQLNSAVRSLNEWQQEYKVQIETSQRNLELQASAMEKAKDSLGEIADNVSSLAEQSKIMPEIAKGMKDANTEILNNFTSMRELLESMANIKSRAENVLPEIEESIAKMTKALENSANDLGSQIKETLEQTHNGINANFNKFDEQMQQELSKILETMGTNLTSLSNKFVEDYTPLTDKLRSLVHAASRENP